MHDNQEHGDDRYYNNVFVQKMNLTMYDNAKLPVFMEGNVFLTGASPCKQEKEPLVKADFNPEIRLVEKPDGSYLEGRFEKAWRKERTRQLVTTKLLGKAKIPNQPYENADGSPLRIATDYFGKKRATGNPFPGPIEHIGEGKQTIKVWPKP